MLYLYLVTEIKLTKIHTVHLIIIIISTSSDKFSQCIEAITTSLITPETSFPEECAFIIGFSCIVWTNIVSFLALYLMVCYLNSSPPTNIRKVRGPQKGTETM